MPSRPSSTPAVHLFAWLGGAWFVAALALGGRFFAVVLAQPADWTATPVLPRVLWNVALLTGFALHHSLMARTSAKVWIVRAVPAVLERSTYVWVASTLLVLVCTAWERVPGVLYSVDGWPRVALGLVQAAGLVLTIAGARVLDGLELAGIRQVMRDASAAPIRIVWPFTVVRHPIYLGWVLMVFAATPMTLDRAVWAVTTTAYLVLAVPWEERSLLATAGAAYADYCARVRWRIVPGLY